LVVWLCSYSAVAGLEQALRVAHMGFACPYCWGDTPNFNDRA
jgi:hypothetical protein